MAGGWTELKNLAERKLRGLADAHQLRSLPDWYGTSSKNFASNDYLALGADARFQELAREATKDLAVGSGASRLLGGGHPVFSRIEAQAAALVGSEAALYFTSGYHANEALCQVLNLGDVGFFSDALNHASMIDGFKLAKLNANQKIVFPHRDYQTLETQLKKSTALCHVIFTESLFSMDGDFADLQTLDDLARQYRGILVVDEAHSIGVYGAEGRGLCHQQHLNDVITIVTCGKALGAQGAFLCGPTWLRDLLINTARPFIYTTAPSLWTAAAVGVSLDYIKGLEDRRAHLHALSEDMRSFLQQHDYDCGTSSSHIIPIICGENARALELEQRFKAQKIFVKGIRPPTVPQGQARLRLSLHSNLTFDDIQRFKRILIS